MSWNNAYERKKFEARQKKQSEEYRALGMTEEQIKEMYEFDLEQYKSDRRYHMHTQPFTSSDFDDGEDDDSESTLLNKFFDELTVTIDSSSEQSRYWWIEEIEDEELAYRVKCLSSDEIEMLTVLAFDGYTQAEAAKKMGSLTQKHYTPPMLPLRCIRNKGERDKFYISNTHEAIISRNDFEAVQKLLADRNNKTIQTRKRYLFSHMIICSHCGWAYRIVAHTLINKDEQVFFAGDYQKRINSPIITTGNELVKQQIADFSGQLNMQELYSYIFEVKESTEEIVKSLSYTQLTQKVSEERKDCLKSLNVVNTDKNAVWLIDYWCNKDVRGLIQMPFSRHWIMHIEACLRIKSKI